MEELVPYRMDSIADGFWPCWGLGRSGGRMGRGWSRGVFYYVLSTL